MINFLGFLQLPHVESTTPNFAARCPINLISIFCAMIRLLALLTSLLFNLELILVLFMTKWTNKVNIYVMKLSILENDNYFTFCPSFTIQKNKYKRLCNLGAGCSIEIYKFHKCQNTGGQTFDECLTVISVMTL